MDGSARILVVDDDPDFLASMRPILESDFYRVAVAPGEEEAFAEIEADKPDILILDVIMSEWDSGFQLMWRLKRDERYEDIPILMVTGVDREFQMSFARHADSASRTPDEEACLPVEHYLVKPVKANELLGSVKRILRQAQKRAAVR